VQGVRSPRLVREPSRAADGKAVTCPGRLAPILAPLARPGVAFVLALVVYLARARLSPGGWSETRFAYFNWLADAFLHGQFHLRLEPPDTRDLIAYGDQLYLYWPPFPAVLFLPLVALFGVGLSDVIYTAVLGAFTVACVAWLLQALDRSGVAPLDAARRAILVLTMAFGSVVLILAPFGTVWFTAQIIGWGCVLLAAIAAFSLRGPWGYLLVGLALACALATRNGLVFNGVWIAYYLLWRDRHEPLRQRALSVLAGLAPALIALLLLGWYNAARFGSPLETGLRWHQEAEIFAGDFERYGVFNLHYLPTNLRYQFLNYTAFSDERWLGGGLFWMTPVLLGAFGGLWVGRRSGLTWAMLVGCVLVYVPIGLLMGTGYLTFGPRYLLDLMVPLLILTARGIRRWPLWLLLVLALIGLATYAYGSFLWRDLDYALL
jgi:hypothetical protein